MKTFITTLILICFSNSESSAQIESDTLYFNDIEVRIYAYEIEQDTVKIAYYGSNTQRVFNEVNTNSSKPKKVLDYDSIMYSIKIKRRFNYSYPTDLKSSVLITKYKKDLLIDTSSAITTDSYWISAINHFSKQIENDSTNYLNYYNYVDARLKYGHYNYDNIISKLEKCIELNNEFEKAYILKSRVHESWGRSKGLMVANYDNHNIVDMSEIEKAINCLEDLLRIKPLNLEAREYRDKLMKFK